MAVMVQSAVSHRVLVVADEPGAAEALRALLELWGHDVLAAADPAIAVALAATLRPAVVMLDVARPGAHGLAVARRLRELPWGTAPTVVAAAGPDERSVRLRAWEAGCTH